MKYTNQNFIVFIFILISIFLSGQNTTIVYELTYRPSTNNKDSLVKSRLYYLDILNQESVFRSEFRRISDSLIFFKSSYGYGYNLNFNDQIYLKKDIKTNKAVKYIISPISKDKFYVNITEILNWKLFPESKIIENIKCQRAEVNYGGRHWIAYFTQDIQLSEGPHVFHGLPGLIIQISDSNQNYIFKLVRIKKFNHNNLFSFNEGNKLSWEMFNKIQIDYYNDPYSFAKVYNMKVATDDGMGGIKKVDIREDTFRIQKYIRKNDNIIELNQKIEYKP